MLLQNAERVGVDTNTGRPWQVHVPPKYRSITSHVSGLRDTPDFGGNDHDERQDDSPGNLAETCSAVTGLAYLRSTPSTLPGQPYRRPCVVDKRHVERGAHLSYL